MRKKYFYGIAYSLIHFSVEVGSFYFLFSRISTSPLYWVLALLFDALAFLPQGIIGNITDRFPKLNIGVVGTVMMLAAFLIPYDLPALTVLALGNAMIHISGARHTLRDSDGQIGPMRYSSAAVRWVSSPDSCWAVIRHRLRFRWLCWQPAAWRCC